MWKGSILHTLEPRVTLKGESVSVNFPRLLVVEDEDKLLGHLVTTLTDESYSVFTCATFRELETMLSMPTAEFEVVVLDRLLNGRDSATLIPRIKDKTPDAKILILSAINTPAEKAAILDQGADDYLAKPFETNELLARLRVLTRRSRPVMKLGNLELDSESRAIKVAEQTIGLTNKEYILLRVMLRAPRKVFSKAFFSQQVWDMSSDVESNVIEVTINKLRRRLEDVGATVRIKNSRNNGYWIEE